MTRISRLSAAAALSIAILLPALGAHAATQLFTNFGPKLTFYSFEINTVNGPAFFGFGSGTTYLASSFTTPTFSSLLDHIDLALVEFSCGQAAAKGVAVDLVTDNGGKPNEAAAAIQHWLVTKIPGCNRTIKSTKLSVPLTVNITLAGSTTYWVVLTPIGLDDTTRWYDGLTNNGSSVDSTDGGRTWFHHSSQVHPYSLDVWSR